MALVMQEGAGKHRNLCGPVCSGSQQQRERARRRPRSAWQQRRAGRRHGFGGPAGCRGPQARRRLRAAPPPGQLPYVDLGITFDFFKSLQLPVDAPVRPSRDVLPSDCQAGMCRLLISS